METSFSLNQTLFEFVNASEGANELVVLFAKGLAIFSPWAVISVLVWYWIVKSPEVRFSLMLAGVALGLGLAVNFTLAYLFYVPRPYEMGIGNTLLSHAAETSFPSDHATFMWALGFGLIATSPLRRIGIGISLLGLSVAWARIYLGVHFPLDMFASLIISVCSAAIAKSLSGKLDKIFFRPIERINHRIISAISNRWSD